MKRGEDVQSLCVLIEGAASVEALQVHTLNPQAHTLNPQAASVEAMQAHTLKPKLENLNPKF